MAPCNFLNEIIFLFQFYALIICFLLRFENGGVLLLHMASMIFSNGVSSTVGDSFGSLDGFKTTAFSECFKMQFSVASV